MSKGSAREEKRLGGELKAGPALQDTAGRGGATSTRGEARQHPPLDLAGIAQLQSRTACE